MAPEVLRYRHLQLDLHTTEFNTVLGTQIGQSSNLALMTINSLENPLSSTVSCMAGRWTQSSSKKLEPLPQEQLCCAFCHNAGAGPTVVVLKKLTYNSTTQGGKQAKRKARAEAKCWGRLNTEDFTAKYIFMTGE